MVVRSETAVGESWFKIQLALGWSIFLAKMLFRSVLVALLHAQLRSGRVHARLAVDIDHVIGVRLFLTGIFEVRRGVISHGGFHQLLRGTFVRPTWILRPQHQLRGNCLHACRVSVAVTSAHTRSPVSQ